MSIQERRQALGRDWGFWMLVVLELVTAANAVGGGIYGLAGAEGVPPEWLDGSPFESYVIPSLVLLVVVGGSMAIAAAALLTRQSHAAEISIGAGVILLVWLVIEVLIIPFSWLQPTFLVVALAVIVLGLRARTTGTATAGAAPGRCGHL